MLPEMFCSANACACRPDTAVVNASKIPMTLPLHSILNVTNWGRDGWPNAMHLPAIAVPLDLSLYINSLYGRRGCDRGPDMPTYRQILPGWNASRHAAAAPRRLVSDKFAVF